MIMYWTKGQATGFWMAGLMAETKIVGGEMYIHWTRVVRPSGFSGR